MHNDDQEKQPSTDDASFAPVNINEFALSPETIEMIRRDARKHGASTEDAPISVVVPLENNSLALGMAEGGETSCLTGAGALKGVSLFSMAFYVGLGSQWTCCSIGGRLWCRRWG